MKKIAVVTTTRADYGLLRNLIKLISDDVEFELQLIVSGTHLSNKYGHTIEEITKDGFKIKKTINYLLDGNTSNCISKSMGLAMIAFADAFEELKPDMLIVLGDRYELISICACAVNYRIPITHISGGEITEGALDDIYRNCTTKMSTLHFPACTEYKNRIVQMGENPLCVFDYGDIGVENIFKIQFLCKEELENELKLDLNKKTILFTYHPVTAEKINSLDEIKEIISALKCFDKWNIIITGSNADCNGDLINEYLKEFSSKNSNVSYFTSLGIIKYLSLMKYSTCVVGNSSSGIVEAPILKIPTVNIGTRQKGRLQANTILNTKVSSKEIIHSIKVASSSSFINSLGEFQIYYKLGSTSQGIINEIKNYFKNNQENKKIFYDIKF